MEASNFQRWSVACDGFAFVGKCVYKHLTKPAIVWDIESVLDGLRRIGEKRTSKDWRRWFACLLCSDEFFSGEQHYKFRSQHTPTSELANVCTTLALYTFLFRSWIASFTLKDVCNSYINFSVKRACEAVGQFGVSLPMSNGANIVVDQTGRVRGLAAAMASLQTQIVVMIVSDWNAMHTNGILCIFDEEVLPMVDLFIFLARHKRWRKIHRYGRAVSTVCVHFFKELASVLLGWLAVHIESYLINIYTTRYDVMIPPPALRRQREGTRRYVRVSPETIWSMVEDSTRSGCTLRQTMDLRSGHSDIGGLRSNNCERWEHLAQELYFERASILLTGASHFCLSADGSTHGYKDTFVGIGYSWELEQTVFARIQHIQLGRDVMADEDNLESSILALNLVKKLERVAAYRQMQAVGNMVEELTGKLLGVDFLPPCNLEAIGENEKRLVRRNGNRDDVYYVNNIELAATKVLPDSLEDVSVLSLLLDQGSIGAASCGFADSLKLMLHFRFEKVHRLIRDIKGPLEHCCSSVFLKSQVFSSFLWDLHRRPFGSGLHGTLMERALDLFAMRNTIHSARFKKYLPRLAEELGMPADTEHEQQKIFDCVSDLRTIRRRVEVSKLGRWFSWNGAAIEHLPCFSALKLILEDFLDAQGMQVGDPDEARLSFDQIKEAAKAKTPQAQLSQLRRCGGGLQLAYRVMSTQMMMLCRMVLIATKACWDWYTFQTTQVQTPALALRDTVAKSDGSWACDSHLAKTFQHAWYNNSSLVYMGLGPAGMNCSKIRHRVGALPWSIVQERAWSLAARYSVSPDTYAGVLSARVDVQMEVMARMKANFSIFNAIEAQRHTIPVAKELWEDTNVNYNGPNKLLHLFFERDRYDPGCVPGRKLLRGLTQTLADNKATEELHHNIRMDARGHANLKQSVIRKQSAVLASKVLATRGIPHRSLVTKETFLKKAAERKSVKGSARKHMSWKHKLPAAWSRLLGAKRWQTTSEAEGRKSAAAWAWITHLGSLRRQGIPLPGLSLALYSRLILPKMIVCRQVDNNQAYASMGNYKWAALLWSLTGIVIDERRHVKFKCGPRDGVEWTHIENPDAWQAYAYDWDESVDHGLVVQLIGEPESLVRAALRQHPRLSYDLLFRLATAHFHLEDITIRTSRVQLLKALVDHVAGDDEAYKLAIAAAEDEDNAKGVSWLANDPLFEATFEEMSAEDRRELTEVTKEIGLAKQRRRVASQQGGRCTRPRLNPKAKAKAKAKPHPAPPPPVAEPAIPPPPVPMAKAKPKPMAKPHPAPPPPVAEPAIPPPPELAPLDPEAVADLAMHRLLARSARGFQWGRRFVLAEVWPGGVLGAWSARCYIHANGGCNKTLNLGVRLTADEAKQRIMEWCVRGQGIPDIPGLRKRTLHMEEDPREYNSMDLRSVEDLTLLAAD